MSNLQRYIFGLLWLMTMLWLVYADKVYATSQPVPQNAYYIVAVFTVWCLIGADNLTNIISILIKRFFGDGK